MRNLQERKLVDLIREAKQPLLGFLPRYADAGASV